MIAKPCLVCGEISEQSRCTEHRLKANRPRRDHVASANAALWKRLSARVRRDQPWCLDCGATTNLSADHLLPVSDAPELAYAIENLTTRCLSCNGKRGNRFTRAEAEDVLKRPQATHKRRPTKSGGSASTWPCDSLKGAG